MQRQFFVTIAQSTRTLIHRIYLYRISIHNEVQVRKTTRGYSGWLQVLCGFGGRKDKIKIDLKGCPKRPILNLKSSQSNQNGMKMMPKMNQRATKIQWRKNVLKRSRKGCEKDGAPTQRTPTNQEKDYPRSHEQIDRRKTYK